MQGCDLEDAGYGLHDAGCEKFPNSWLLAVWRGCDASSQ
jgi:hypothetical protein